jgi:predicted TIM-barrel fold metal-dependent hydrolase
MPAGPGLGDEQVPGWWAGLGLPGLVDVHVHFLPPPVLRKVRAQFDQAGPLIGRAWPLVYRGSDEERVAQLRAMGVRRFSALPYAHRPGIAEYLNGWAAELADEVPEVIRSATLYPEEGVEEYVAARIASGVEVFKVHVQVGDIDVLDPQLDRVWGMLADARVPVVIHVNSGPVATPRTGPGPLRALMAAHPDLTLVLAHMGAPHYDEFMAVAEKYERVHLDTTMAFTAFTEAVDPFPQDRLGDLVSLQDRILFGSDFPNIPYRYVDAVDAVLALGLGVDWERAVLHDNAARLLGEVETAAGV